MDVQQLIAELMALPLADRQFVVDTVYETMPPEEIPPEHLEELNRRLDALEANPDDCIPWDPSFKRIREKL